MSQPDTADRPETTPAKRMPEYRGAPLDPERGPGLGCFWIQIGLLAVLLVATPLSVILVAPPWFSAALLILTLVLLLFVGQTTIFLLRLVAVDRRSRRRPMGTDARRTVGQLEDEARAASEGGNEPAAEDEGSAENDHQPPANGAVDPDHQDNAPVDDDAGSHRI